MTGPRVNTLGGFARRGARGSSEQWRDQRHHLLFAEPGGWPRSTGARAGTGMEALLVSFGTVAMAEMGDRTQLLSLMLAARFRRPWPIMAGILVATLANHLAAGILGAFFGRLLSAGLLDLIVGVSLLAMALWTLVPDRLDDAGDAAPRGGVFLATAVAFFIAEIGDKTQIATVALAAGYPNLAAVVTGTTAGMLAANFPVVLLGHAFARRLPLRALHIAASVLLFGLGLLFLLRGFRG